MTVEEKAKEYTKIPIKNEYQLQNMCEEFGFTLYVEYNELGINMEKIEKRFTFLKNLHYNKILYYSYSIKAINNYFGKEVLEEKKSITQSPFTINYLIYLFHKYKYWDNI